MQCDVPFDFVGYYLKRDRHKYTVEAEKLLFSSSLLLLLLLLLFIRLEIIVPFINLNLTIRFYYRFVISNQVALLF